jgi:isoleucyl-tRNA synthetase
MANICRKFGLDALRLFSLLARSIQDLVKSAQLSIGIREVLNRWLNSL